jgi:hypothetical protein
MVVIEEITIDLIRQTTLPFVGSRIVERVIFTGWSKIPRCKAPEVLRSEAYLNVRCNKPAPCLTRGKMRGTQQMPACR